MKKNILKLVFTSAFALVVGYSVYASQQKVELSDLTMENIEALANDNESSAKGCKLHLTSICETSHKDHYLYRNR
ncbi:NVEALA domain-containing protein [Phocaeicola plebeius]|uniref:NVEALA domain-containing protein n=1 Tax=Phocaeicola plebeius TaxID=310297 RepID=UPI002941DE5A|nr:NVEALA domain-containing protein [Phocaeicola plebeius]